MTPGWSRLRIMSIPNRKHPTERASHYNPVVVMVWPWFTLSHTIRILHLFLFVHLAFCDSKYRGATFRHFEFLYGIKHFFATHFSTFKPTDLNLKLFLENRKVLNLFRMFLIEYHISP